MNVRCEDRLDLPAAASAARSARMFTRLTLTRWGAGASDFVENALLIVSELVNSAVKAAGITEPGPKCGVLAPLQLTVHLLGLDASVVIAVWAAAPGEPVVRHAALHDEGGRGLGIAEHIVKRWGTYPHHGGTMVWAELPVYTPLRDRLPKRQPAHPAHIARGTAARPTADLQLLRRVIHGLRDL